MADLKSAAKARAKSRRSKGPAEDDGISAEDPVAPPEEYKPTPNIISGQAYDQPPPLPAPFLLLRYKAAIPALRKALNG